MTSQGRLRAARVLVVEDDESIASLIVALLDAEGLRAEARHSCAATAATTDHYSVGVFDVDLPDGCGVDLAAEMKSSGRVAHAVFFTGGVAAARLARAEEVGRVLMKGSDTLALSEEVKRLLSLPSTMDSPGQAR